MKVLYYHQYFSIPAGPAGTRSYALARSLVEAGHQVQMVCLQDARTHTGLSGPFTAGRRSGLVDGIEVIEFDLPYSNHSVLLKRALVFLGDGVCAKLGAAFSEVVGRCVAWCLNLVASV